MFISKCLYEGFKVQFLFPLLINYMFAIKKYYTELMGGDALHIDLNVDLHCAKDNIYC